jgi:hypothetical protein
MSSMCVPLRAPLRLCLQGWKAIPETSELQQVLPVTIAAISSATAQLEAKR